MKYTWLFAAFLALLTLFSSCEPYEDSDTYDDDVNCIEENCHEVCTEDCSFGDCVEECHEECDCVYEVEEIEYSEPVESEFSDCENSDCSVEEENPEPLSSGLCGLCKTHDDCYEQGALCLWISDDVPTFCGRTCNSDDDCPSQFECKNLIGVDGSQCIPIARSCKDIPKACDPNHLCMAGQHCSDGFCIDDECSASKPCASGQHCKEGLCIADECSLKSDCEENMHCEQGVCVEDQCSDSLACNENYHCEQGICVEDQCNENLPCEQGQHCEQGICVDDECSEHQDCQGIQICQNGICVDVECLNNDHCSENQWCVNTHCVDLCEKHDDCPVGSFCQKTFGYCLPSETYEQPCNDSNDCTQSLGELCYEQKCVLSCSESTPCPWNLNCGAQSICENPS